MTSLPPAGKITISSLVWLDNTRHCLAPPRRVCLSPSCARSANNGQSRRSSCVLPSLDLVTHDACGVTKDSAYRLQRTCAESAAGVLGLVFCPIAVWRRIAQGRRGADHRPLDSRIKRARCVVVGRQSVQKLIATFLASPHITKIRVLLCAQEVSATCGRGLS